MPTTVEIASKGKTVTTSCVVELPTKAKATKKGLKVLLYTWLGALVTIPIPIVHFVTVPAAILLGPLFGFLTYRTALTRASITCPDAACPECAKSLPLAFASDVAEIERTCKGCSSALKIKTLATASN